MITAIAVTNFQSIPHARIELDQWTSLVGESDVGKSAVVRALAATLTNWRGDHFIRQGAKSCEVLIWLTTGEKIHWEKRRGKSGIYTVAMDPLTTDVRVFEKTGGEVPEEVQALLRIAVDVSGDALTPGLQMQHDAPFLFADTARRRAQILGEFDGTNLLLLADGTVRGQQRSEQRAASDYRTEAEQAEENLRAMDWVDGAVALGGAARAGLARADEQARVADSMEMSRTDLATGAAMIASYAADLATIDTAAATEPLRAAQEGALGVAVMQDTADQLRAASAAIQAVADYEAPDLEDAWGEAEALEGMLLTKQQVIIAEETVRAGVVAERDQRRAVRAAYADLEALVGVTCPTCGAPLTAEGLGL